MEELFRRGIMIMGPSPKDPTVQVGVLNMTLLAGFPAERTNKLREMDWLAGDWISENRVPAATLNPAYVEPGATTMRFCEKGAWLCRVRPDGRELPFVTYDPFSKQWMYILAEGAFGILRSPGWVGNRIVFEGYMTMIGVDCQMRQTWTKANNDEYRFINEERLPDGSWAYIDEWELRRRK